MLKFLCKLIGHRFSKIDFIIFEIEYRGPIGGPNPDVNAKIKCQHCRKEFTLAGLTQVLK